MKNLLGFIVFFASLNIASAKVWTVGGDLGHTSCSDRAIAILADALKPGYSDFDETALGGLSIQYLSRSEDGPVDYIVLSPIAEEAKYIFGVESFNWATGDCKMD